MSFNLVIPPIRLPIIGRFDKTFTKSDHRVFMVSIHVNSKEKLENHSFNALMGSLIYRKIKSENSLTIPLIAQSSISSIIENEL
jgi:hypothetical protein